MRITKYIIFLFILFVACGKSEKPQPRTNFTKNTGFGDTLRNINKVLIQKDKERINAYAERMSYDMKESETGLRYRLIEKLGQSPITDNDVVTINYRVELLDGTVAYEGERKLKTGKTDSEAGLQEGLKMLGKGDSAVFIAPPYLAKGLLGDFEKIPARSILVYKLRVLDKTDF